MILLIFPILSFSLDFDGGSFFSNLKDKVKNTVEQIGEAAQEIGNTMKEKLNDYANQQQQQFTSPDESKSTFTKIEVSGSLTVSIKQGEEESIQVDDAISKYVKTVILNKILYISMENSIKSIFTTGEVHVTVICLHKIKVTGSSTVISESTIKTNNIDIELSGASDVTMNLFASGCINIAASGSSDLKLNGNANSFSVKVSGASDVKLIGETYKLGAVVSGSSNLKAYDLIAKVVNIILSGVSDAEVTATEELKHQVTGSADLHYRGKPRVKKGVSQFDL